MVSSRSEAEEVQEQRRPQAQAQANQLGRACVQKRALSNRALAEETRRRQSESKVPGEKEAQLCGFGEGD